VFAAFAPKLPAEWRASKYVFLANIDPRLQHAVLDQIESPALVACDTMNHWIAERRDDLVRLLRRVDLITLNDGEARQLTGSANLVQAARWILDRGPRFVIIKKGEHGAFLFDRDSIFFAPAYPLEQVFDPTGAGDSFAGGFMGWLAKTDDLSLNNMRRAVVYGSAMGSFAVEKFSFERLLEVTPADLTHRFNDFRTLVTFDREMPA
jgi:sugar/nucleoside kinase (ribokinase family)